MLGKPFSQDGSGISYQVVVPHFHFLRFFLCSNRLKEPGSADTILSETGRRASDYSKAWKDRQSHSQLLAARQQLSDTLGAQNLRDSMASNLDLLSLAGSAGM